MKNGQLTTELLIRITTEKSARSYPVSIFGSEGQAAFSSINQGDLVTVSGLLGSSEKQYDGRTFHNVYLNARTVTLMNAASPRQQMHNTGHGAYPVQGQPQQYLQQPGQPQTYQQAWEQRYQQQPQQQPMPQQQPAQQYTGPTRGMEDLSDPDNCPF